MDPVVERESRPLPEELQAALRELIRQRGLTAAASAMHVHRVMLATAAAGGTLGRLGRFQMLEALRVILHEECK